MRRPRRAWTTLTLGILATGGCGERGVPDSGPRPWSLEASVLEAGEGLPFCEETMARVDAFMSRFEGQVPPSDQYGGSATAGTPNEMPGLNAHVIAENTSLQHQIFINHMTLVRYDEDKNPQPYLAESWVVSGDNREITFHTRDDVYWHDGELTDAYDVAYTVERATDPETGFQNSGWWTYMETGPGAIEVIDSFTIRFRMKPHADFMDMWTMLAIMPQHLLEDLPAAELQAHPYGTVCPVGNGPFIFTEHRQNASWAFQANPSFPEGLGGRPYLDRYVYRILPEQTTLLTELLTESLDVYIQPTPDQAEAILDSDAVDLRRYHGRGYVFVAWNSRRPQLADKKVRMAITKATNREEIVAGILGEYAVVSNGTVPPDHPLYNESLGVEAMAYDPNAARALLDEAGWIDRDGDGVRENREGVRLSFTIKFHENRSRRAVALIMQAQLAEIGIEVIPTEVEWITLAAQFQNADVRDFDGVVLAWQSDFRLDDTVLFHSDHVDGPNALSGTRRADIDRALERLPLIADPEEQRAGWDAYQELLIDEQSFTFVYQPDRLVGVNKRVRGVVMDIRGQWLNVKDWWIPSDERRRGSR